MVAQAENNSIKAKPESPDGRVFSRSEGGHFASVPGLMRARATTLGSVLRLVASDIILLIHALSACKGEQ